MSNTQKDLFRSFLFIHASVGADIDQLYKEWDAFLAESNQTKPLFASEDGIVIYENDKVCLLSTNNWLTTSVVAPVSPFYGAKDEFKYFSTKMAAEQYILAHKPCLTLKEVTDILYKGGDFAAIISNLAKEKIWPAK
jgi:hypothetical protein